MTSPRPAGLMRRAQSWLVRRVRRSRWFPKVIPDRLGEDEQLRGKSLSARILVYFADTQESLYQIEQWYRALRALARVHPLVVICQDSRSAARIRLDGGLPVHVVARYGTLDDLLARSDVRLALYVNHNPRNFECLRFTSLTHVYLGHGDSDKGVSASNQLKAYDYCFVAGQAAVDRIGALVPRYDAASRCVCIGQPQLDGTGLLPGAEVKTHRSRDRIRVLYAPTWEGAQPSVAYSSLVSHGPALVGSVLAAGFAITYRPHPLSGVASSEHADADRRVRELVFRATKANSVARHRVDTSVPLAVSFADADVLVCDVSGVIQNWLPSGKPVVVTKPLGEAATEATTPFPLPRLEAADAVRASELIRAILSSDDSREVRRAAVAYYLVNAVDGAATEAFVAACDRCIEGSPQRSPTEA